MDEYAGKKIDVRVTVKFFNWCNRCRNNGYRSRNASRRSIDSLERFRACLLNLPSYSSLAMKKEEVDKLYLNRNKVLCRFAGVWPYQANISRYLTRSLVLTISLTAISTMILRMVVFFSPDVLMEQCPFLVAASGIIIKLTNYSLKYDELKGFMNGMYNDWEVNRPPAEIEIMDVYSKRGVLFTMAYIVTALFGTVVFIMMPTAAGIVEYFTRSENGTVHRYYVYPAYYPFDEDRYFIYFWAHMAIGICMVAIVYTACDALYLYGVQHACGLLAVAGYRFKSAVEDYAYDEKESLKTMDMAYKNVCSSIHGQKRALRFIQDIQELHSTYLAIAVVLVITAFSVTLVKVQYFKYVGGFNLKAAVDYCMKEALIDDVTTSFTWFGRTGQRPFYNTRITMAIYGQTSLTDVGFEFYKYMGFLVVQLIHLFFLTSQGQFVQNAYDDIYNEMYGGQWYNSSPKTQMLYVLALRETLTAPVLSAGGLLPLTMETFAEVLKASVSYFTVLKSQ